MSRTADYFEYLDELRHSGKTNMFGAAPYLQDAFGLERDAARDILANWMATFDPRRTPEQRANEADGAA